MAVKTEAFYLPATSGDLFCVLTRPPPGCTVAGAVLYLHPFAEEMNKTRRMAALGARGLAAAGYVVLQVDLHACGDSAGNFAQATWSTWQEDAASAARWLMDRNYGPFWIWGLRAGALIAGAVLEKHPDAAGLLLWQPVLIGRRHLTQFLRLKIAEDLSGAARDDTQTLRAHLAAGEPLEIAGYQLSPALAAGLDAAELGLPPGYAGRVIWIEVRAEGGALSAAVVSTAARWREAGVRVEVTTVVGPSFWQTREIEECPALLTESARMLEKR